MQDCLYCGITFFLLLLSPLPYFSISVLQKVFSETEVHRMHFSSLPMLVFKHLETSEQVKRNVHLSFSSPRPQIVACDTLPALSNLGNQTSFWELALFFAVTRVSREGAGQSDLLAGSVLCNRPDVLDLLRIMCLQGRMTFPLRLLGGKGGLWLGTQKPAYLLGQLCFLRSISMVQQERSLRMILY